MGRLIDKKKMKTKIVYTLVSDAADTYLEQALLSVYSLRLYNPHIVVSLVVDQETGKTISGGRAEIKKYVTDIVEVEVPLEYSKVQKSRYLKTNLRKLIRGDYLFIDCDTIICGSLEGIDRFDVEIGMVADVNGDNAVSVEDAQFILTYYVENHISGGSVTWADITGNPKAPKE